MIRVWLCILISSVGTFYAAREHTHPLAFMPALLLINLCVMGWFNDILVWQRKNSSTTGKVLIFIASTMAFTALQHWGPSAATLGATSWWGRYSILFVIGALIALLIGCLGPLLTWADDRARKREEAAAQARIEQMRKIQDNSSEIQIQPVYVKVQTGDYRSAVVQSKLTGFKVKPPKGMTAARVIELWVDTGSMRHIGNDGVWLLFAFKTGKDN